MNKNKEQLSNNNNNNSNNNNNNEKNKSSATNLQHANTLSGASSKFLAEEIRHMRDDPSLDKKTKTKKSKSTTIKEGEELMVMAPDGTTKKKKNAKEVDEVLDQGQRRLSVEVGATNHGGFAAHLGRVEDERGDVGVVTNQAR